MTSLLASLNGLIDATKLAGLELTDMGVSAHAIILRSLPRSARPAAQIIFSRHLLMAHAGTSESRGRGARPAARMVPVPVGERSVSRGGTK